MTLSCFLGLIFSLCLGISLATYDSPGPYLFSAHGSVKQAVSMALTEFKVRQALNEELARSGNDEFNEHSRMIGQKQPWNSSATDSDFAMIMTRSTQILSNKLGKPVPSMYLHPAIKHSWWKLTGSLCRPRQPVCVKTPYRTADGSCNNLAVPIWGMSGRGQRRYLPSAYSDGVDMPRMFSVTGKPLPSPRLISNMIHQTPQSDIKSPHLSIMFMQFGQVVSHDVVETPMLRGANQAKIMCCNLDMKIRHQRPECFPIPVPKGDKEFESCLNFVRSVPAQNDACLFGIREQKNELTSFLDANFLYGANDESMRELRAFTNGFLKMTKMGQFTKETQPYGDCKIDKHQGYCMKAGDPRIHIAPWLAGVEMVFLREHNRIASILAKINTHWPDERLFQETRKIIIGINQHIVYTEYLPKVFGPLLMHKFGLVSTKFGHNTVYDPTVNPTVTNGFSVAAFRFGHTQIPNMADLTSIKGQTEFVPIEQTFNDPTVQFVHGGHGSEYIVRGMCDRPAARTDPFLDNGVRNLLFLNEKGRSSDLASMNIQRGRDHGVPGYNAWRKWCGLPPAYHFAPAPGGLIDIDPKRAMMLGKLYSHPDDIDLFTGGLSERHVPGGVVGPTFACIMARQFQEIKFGDRFWYENYFPHIGFTKSQLAEIKNIRLSNLICENIPTKAITPDSFLTPSPANPKVPCKSLRRLNLEAWRESPGIHPMPMAKPFIG